MKGLVLINFMIDTVQVFAGDDDLLSSAVVLSGVELLGAH